MDAFDIGGLGDILAEHLVNLGLHGAPVDTARRMFLSAGCFAGRIAAGDVPGEVMVALVVALGLTALAALAWWGEAD